MAQKHETLCSALGLGMLLTASLILGEEPRSGGVAAGTNAQVRALADSIPRRELELALRQRQDVLAEVKQRIRTLGVKASAEALTELLLQAAHLEIGEDKCNLGLIKAGDCRAMKAENADVERRFRQATGLSVREFRSGRRETSPPAEPLLRAGEGNSGGSSDGGRALHAGALLGSTVGEVRVSSFPGLAARSRGDLPTGR